MEKCARFEVGTARGIGNRVIEFGDLGLEFLRSSPDFCVAPNIYAKFAKVTVSTDVIEVHFCVDDLQLVSRPRNRRVAVNGLGS